MSSGKPGTEMCQAKGVGVEHYEVIIVGAGPAGAACAKVLHDAGISVLLLEKEKLPRNKICSGVLFGQTQELLQKYFNALPPENVYCEPRTIDAANILEWDRGKNFHPYAWEIPMDGHEFPQVYYNIWRANFDAWLIKQSGAPVRENCLARNVTIEEEKIRVHVFQKDLNLPEPTGGNQNQVLCCDYLVGADGGSSSVRRVLDPSWYNRETAAVIYQVYCPVIDQGSLTDGFWYVFLDHDFGDILSCAHRKDSCLTLCVGGFKGRDLQAGMQAFKAFLNEQFHVVLDQEERVEGCMLHPGAPDLGKGKILLTGEAAGFMYLNGEGISAALDSGHCAGASLVQALQDGSDALEIYSQNTAGIMKHMQKCREQAHFLAGQAVSEIFPTYNKGAQQ